MRGNPFWTKGAPPRPFTKTFSQRAKIGEDLLQKVLPRTIFILFFIFLIFHNACAKRQILSVAFREAYRPLEAELKRQCKDRRTNYR